MSDATGAAYEISIDLDGFEPLVLQRDVSAAGWVADSVWDPSLFATAGGLVPPAFEAIARVRYPYRDQAGLMNLRPLIDVLARHTSTPGRVWFCLWEGYGGLADPPAGVPRLDVPRHQPMRSYYLYAGPLGAIGAMAEFPMHQVPDLTWPEDRAWFLGSDTDLEGWGLVGASSGCIAGLEAEPSLAAVRVGRADPLV